MTDELLDVGAGGLEVLARVEVIRMLSHVFSDVTSHSKTDIGIDVDLADGQLCSVTQLFLRNADCIQPVLEQYSRKNSG